MLTIKQVAIILDQQELSPSKSFVEIAIESDFMDRADADQLFQEQRQTSPTIQRLAQECGLLTERQCDVLFDHFQRIGTRPIQRTVASESAEREKTPVPATIPQPEPTNAPQPEPTPYHSVPSTTSVRPRAPKFKQRPVIVSPYTSPSS